MRHLYRFRRFSIFFKTVVSIAQSENYPPQVKFLLHSLKIPYCYIAILMSRMSFKENEL